MTLRASVKAAEQRLQNFGIEEGVEEETSAEPSPAAAIPPIPAAVAPASVPLRTAPAPSLDSIEVDVVRAASADTQQLGYMSQGLMTTDGTNRTNPREKGRQSPFTMPPTGAWSQRRPPALKAPILPTCAATVLCHS